jgi:hypothetical protein
MNIKEYWKSVRRLASDLDPATAALDAEEQDSSLRTHLDLSQKEIWLYSLRSETIGTVEGRVVSAHPILAARLLKESTHVLATPEQVREHKAELAQRRKDTIAAEKDRKGLSAPPQIVISKDVIDALSANPQRPSTAA